MSIQIADDFDAVASAMREGKLLDACAAFLAANRIVKDWDADAIHLEEDESDAAVRAWQAALKIVTGIRATAPAGLRAKLEAGCLALSLHPDEIQGEESVALSAMADAMEWLSRVE